MKNKQKLRHFQTQAEQADEMFAPNCFNLAGTTSLDCMELFLHTQGSFPTKTVSFFISLNFS